MFKFTISIVAVWLASALLFDSAYAQKHEQTGRSSSCEDGLEACVSNRREEFSRRGTLGMLVHPVRVDTVTTNVRQHYRIENVVPHGAAEGAGVKKNDVIVQWNGETFTTDNPVALYTRLQTVSIGENIILSIQRDGKSLKLTVTSTKPDDVTIEYWLLSYVKMNFSEEEFQKYAKEAQVRLTGIPE